MTEFVPATSPVPSRVEVMFPTLTASQMERISIHGHVRPIAQGDVLFQAGDRLRSFFVVRSGQMEILTPSARGDAMVGVLNAGQFTGEVTFLSGARVLVTVRVAEPGEVIEVPRERILAMVQTDPELSDILMRAFIFRRVELIAQKLGDVVLIGSDHCAGTLRVKEFLTRNGHPYSYVNVDQEDDIQQMLDRFQVTEADVPVLICRGKTVLKNPTNEEIADCLGFNEVIDEAQLHDVVIVGAGPSGLAAAVYGASEGLDVLVLELHSPGGQAGSSSRIENYLGFPTGIAGQDLTARAYAQAQKFGARVLVAKGATRLTCERRPYAIEIGKDGRVLARTVIIASGAAYRKPSLENRARFEGAGVYYAATFMEGQCARARR